MTDEHANIRIHVLFFGSLAQQTQEQKPRRPCRPRFLNYSSVSRRSAGFKAGWLLP